MRRPSNGFVPRKHIETITVNGKSGQEAMKLGAFVDNTRRRATQRSPERRAELEELGMRW
ncbi:helicase associated domain-containing protein [Streptomyces sp. NPDC056704]|uniref:helicase associated domain-containing protein n=1 Tax=Streptomyces sp. NPDC056704 TaxID=3345917 RepID=UPI0036AD389E